MAEKKEAAKNTLYCSFCGKSQHEVRKLIAGPTVFICDECVQLCCDIIAEENKPGAGIKLPDGETSNPEKIFEVSKEFIAGQDEPRRALSAIMWHQLRVSQGRSDGEFKPCHTLLIGPTGTGKTTAIRGLANTLNVPLAMIDAGRLTGEGYFKQIDVFLHLLQSVDYNVERAQQGIVLIRQIDSLACGPGGAASGRKAQESLLGILDGTIVTVALPSGEKKAERLLLDTSNIMFVFSGSFAGLSRFSSPSIDMDRNYAGTVSARRQELVRFGMLPELVARLTQILTFDPLDGTAMRQILMGVRHNLIEEFQRRFHNDGIKVTFTDSAVDAMCREAVELGGGGRSLRTILESISLEIAYERPAETADGGTSQHIEVDADLVARSLA